MKTTNFATSIFNNNREQSNFSDRIIGSGAIPGKILDLGLLKISWGLSLPIFSPCVDLS